MKERVFGLIKDRRKSEVKAIFFSNFVGLTGQGSPSSLLAPKF